MDFDEVRGDVLLVVRWLDIADIEAVKLKKTAQVANHLRLNDSAKSSSYGSVFVDGCPNLTCSVCSFPAVHRNPGV